MQLAKSRRTAGNDSVACTELSPVAVLILYYNLQGFTATARISSLLMPMQSEAPPASPLPLHMRNPLWQQHSWCTPIHPLLHPWQLPQACTGPQQPQPH